MKALRDTSCNIVISNEPLFSRKPIIFNPDFFVEKLRHEKPEVFLELVVSNLTRLIDLPGTEFAQLIGEEEPCLPSSTSSSFFRSFNFLKRKDELGFQDSTVAQWLALLPHIARDRGLIPPLDECVEFAPSPRVCVGFLRVLRWIGHAKLPVVFRDVQL
eukprot:g31893.t1